MPAFEITSLGFAGSVEARNVWVWTSSEQWLRESLKGTWYETMEEMDEVALGLSPADYAFIMPKDVQALHDRLRSLAGIPRLNQMVRGNEYMHATRGRVTFVASDPDDGAYLICKYWDTDKDEQAYIGCVTDELRFLPPMENQRP